MWLYWFQISNIFMITKPCSSETTGLHNVDIWTIIFIYFATQYLSDCEKSGNFLLFFVPSFLFHSFFPFLFLTFRAPQSSFLFLLSKMEIKVTPKCLFHHHIHQFTVGFFFSKHSEREGVKKPPFTGPRRLKTVHPFYLPLLKYLL